MRTPIPKKADTLLASSIDAKCELIGGRIGIVAGLAAFILTYASIFQHFGWVAGFALGWLPSALCAWLTAVAMDFLATGLARGSVFLARKAMSGIRHFNPMV